MDALDELLDGYDTRKRAQREAFERDQQESKEIAAKGERILSAIAVPVLRDIAETVGSKGHHCEVKERFGHSLPMVTLEFRPHQVPRLSPSLLMLLVDREGNLKVSSVVELGAVADRSEKKWPLADVSETRVRSQALAFIESVLRASYDFLDRTTACP